MRRAMKTRRLARTLAVVPFVGLALGACDGALDQRLAILDEPRVLAILAEPAEARPGATVAYSLVYGGPDGPIAVSPAWAYCHAPKAPTEDNIVSADCLGEGALIPLSTGEQITATLPADACFVYGPETKPGGFRPRDPDASGGYYQPIRAEIASVLAFGLSRIQCTLGNVSAEISRRYEREYVDNANPTLDPIAIAPASVGADTDVDLGASWPAAAAESYLYYEPVAQALVMRHESMRISWFATGGTIAVDASAVGELSSQRAVHTTWHTPASAGTAHLVVVLRDGRGGTAVATTSVTVTP